MNRIDYKIVEHLHPNQTLLAPVVRFLAISVIEPPSAGNERLMVSFRPAFSKPLPRTALPPLFVACGPSDGGITVDEDDTTITGSPTSGSSSAGTTSSVAGTGGGSTRGVTSGTGGSSTSGAGVGGSDPTGAGDTTLVGIETPGADCPVPNMPAFSELKAYDKLHDPFTMTDGTKVTTRAQWVCRQREISEMIQQYEAGPKQIKEATVAGSFAAARAPRPPAPRLFPPDPAGPEASSGKEFSSSSDVRPPQATAESTARRRRARARAERIAKSGTCSPKPRERRSHRSVYGSSAWRRTNRAAP
ncbi:hypothetical protein WMF30_02195 [Sorangium sp. So ce134]